MTLDEKIKLLRQLEGNLRGLARPLSKTELARMLKEELGESISVAYLSQLESGKRPHMTARTREMLARFFKVHPGYLVSDPEGFRTELTLASQETRIDDVLKSGAYAFDADDPQLASAMRSLARHRATRELVILMAAMAEEPGVLRLLQDNLRTLAASNGTKSKDGERGHRKSPAKKTKFRKESRT